MTPQVESIGQIPRKVYSMTPQALLVNDIGEIPRKVYSMTPQVLVRYLEKYIQ